MSQFTNMILDLGSDNVKAGTAGDALPAAVFPCVVGQPVKKRALLLKKKDETAAAAVAQYLVGQDALHNAAQTSLVRPVRHGIVEDWALFEHIAHHCFAELELEAAATAVTITEPLYQPRQCTERIAQTFFETFNVPEMALLPSGVCALYASGRTTGIVLDSGEGITQVTPVFDNYVIPNATNRLNSGGKEVTDHLRRILTERGYAFSSLEDHFVVQGVKESLCYVAPNYEEALRAEEDPVAEFALPDGQTVAAGKERFRAPEIIFNPAIVHSELPPIHDFLSNAVKACAIDIRKALLSNVVVCGGNTMFSGYGDRLKSEVVRAFPGLFTSINVVESPDRLFSTFAGASVVAKLPSFSTRMVSKAIYEEEGPQALREHVGAADDDDEPPPA